MKRRLMIASLLVGLLAAGLAGGAVLAQGGGGKSGHVEHHPVSGDSPRGDYRHGQGRVRYWGSMQEQVEAAFEAGCAPSMKEEKAGREAGQGLVENGRPNPGGCRRDSRRGLMSRPDGPFPAFEAIRRTVGPRLPPARASTGSGEAEGCGVAWRSSLSMGKPHTGAGRRLPVMAGRLGRTLDFPSFKGYGERGEGHHGKDYDKYGDKH